MRHFPVILQKVATRYYGYLFLAPTRLYFVSGKHGYAWGGGTGGKLIDALVTAKRTDAAAANVATSEMIDEPSVQQAVRDHEGSLIMEAAELSLVRHDWWWCGFKWKDGRKMGLAQRFPPELVRELGLWATANQVPSKGLG